MSNENQPDDSLPDLSLNNVGSSEVPARTNTGGDRKQIGPYKILQKIAEGGMGAVYMAQQNEPIKRRVALKLIKAGRDTEQIIARFDAERQALAMMDHANIARIFDAGTTEEGSPYFVMELVNGVPLTEYCDRNKLSIRERLELFVPVCKAVQHAHTKGIIHRDLKPSNVLVALYDGVAVPKVIDFGLAKATEHQLALTDRTMFTEFGQIVGTLQYMSPEQAEMNQLDVDTRTDIYSLGVMLYELLIGSTPLDNDTMKEQALLKVLELIREREPPTPSSRLSKSGDAIAGVSDQRKIPPVKLRQILKGELDWIVMKSLEKDRTRRYETANAFADDVARFLDDEPVLARPQSSGYRLQKFLRKNRVLVASVLLVATLLFASACISYWFMLDARTQRNVALNNEQEAEEQRENAEKQADIALQKSREADEKSKLAIAERNRADSEKEVAQEVRRFLQDSLVRNISVWERANMRGDGAIAGDNITVRELLDIAASKYSPENIDQAFPNRPRVQSEILQTIGDAYRSIDERELCVKFSRAAAEVSREHFGATSHEYVKGRGNLFFACVSIGEFGSALKAAQEGYQAITQLYKIAREANSPDERKQKLELANEVLDQFADQWFEQMDPTRFAFPVINSDDIDFATKALIAPATVSSRNLAEIVQEMNGPDHDRTKFTRMTQAFFDYTVGLGLNQQQVVDRCIAELRETLTWADTWPENRHRVRALVQTAVGIMMETQKVDPDETLALFQEAYADLSGSLRKDHPACTLASIQLAAAYKDRNRNREAFDLLKEALPNFMLQLGASRKGLEIYADLAAKLNEEEAAINSMRKAHRRCLAIYGLSYRSYSVHRLEAIAAIHFNDPERAIAVLREAFDEAKDKLGVDAEVTHVSSIDLAAILHRYGKFKTCLEQLQFNVDNNQGEFAEKEYINNQLEELLGKANFNLGRFDTAIPHFRNAVKILAGTLGEGHVRVLSLRKQLVECLVRESEFELAIREVRELVRRSGGGLFGSDSPERPQYQQLLARIYHRSGDSKQALAVALPLLDSERAKLKKSGGKDGNFIASLQLDAGTFYRSDGQTEQATKLLQESISLLTGEEKPNPVAVAVARVQLGGAMLDQSSKDYQEIRTLLESSHEFLASRINEPAHVDWQRDLKSARVELVRLYEATGETEKRDRIRAKLEEVQADE